jgi:hypothetical protein
MNEASPAKLTAGCCALGAFAIAIVAGLGADAPVDTILTRAIVCMIVCWPVGALLGFVAGRAIEDGVEAFRRANPVTPDTGGAEARLSSEEEGELVV